MRNVECVQSFSHKIAIYIDATLLYEFESIRVCVHVHMK